MGFVAREVYVLLRFEAKQRGVGVYDPAFYCRKTRCPVYGSNPIYLVTMVSFLSPGITICLMRDLIKVTETGESKYSVANSRHAKPQTFNVLPRGTLQEAVLFPRGDDRRIGATFCFKANTITAQVENREHGETIEIKTPGRMTRRPAFASAEQPAP